MLSRLHDDACYALQLVVELIGRMPFLREPKGGIVALVRGHAVIGRIGALQQFLSQMAQKGLPYPINISLGGAGLQRCQQIVGKQVGVIIHLFFPHELQLGTGGKIAISLEESHLDALGLEQTALEDDPLRGIVERPLTMFIQAVILVFGGFHVDFHIADDAIPSYLARDVFQIVYALHPLEVEDQFCRILGRNLKYTAPVLGVIYGGYVAILSVLRKPISLVRIVGTAEGHDARTLGQTLVTSLPDGLLTLPRQAESSKQYYKKSSFHSFIISTLSFARARSHSA